MAVRSLKNSTLENFANYSSSMNAGYSFQDFELIESVFLASNASSVIFNNLNQYATEYKHLQIRLAIKSNNAAVWEIGLMVFNNDFGANYSAHALQATYQPSLIIRSSGTANAGNMYFSSAGATNSGVSSSAVIDILDSFSDTKNKTIRSLSGYVQPSGGELSLNSGSWRNTAPISSINIFPLSGTAWLATSRFSLYGIR